MSNANRLDPVTLRWAQKQMQAKAAVAVPGSLLRLTFGALADLFAIEAAEADRLAQAPQAMALEWYLDEDGNHRADHGDTRFTIYGAGGGPFLWMVDTTAGEPEPTIEAAKLRCERVAAAMFGELAAKAEALTDEEYFAARDAANSYDPSGNSRSIFALLDEAGFTIARKVTP